jgi:DNA-directed RNA polymerase subunit RPC12/RpoP
MHSSYDLSRIGQLFVPFRYGPAPLGSVDYVCSHCESLISVPLSEDATPPPYVQCPRCPSGVMIQTSD